MCFLRATMLEFTIISAIIYEPLLATEHFSSVRQGWQAY